MTAKEYLSQATWLDRRINSKLEYLESLRRISTKITTTYTRENKSEGMTEKSKIENTIVKILDLENEINSDIDRLIDLKKDIMKKIEGINDTNCQVLLEMRYLSGKSWDDVISTMRYDRSTVFRIHGKALKEVEKIKDATKCD